VTRYAYYSPGEPPKRSELLKTKPLINDADRSQFAVTDMCSLLELLLKWTLYELLYSQSSPFDMSRTTSSLSTTPQPGTVRTCNNAATETLARTPLFQTLNAGMTYEDQVALSYARCRAIIEAYRMLFLSELIGFRKKSKRMIELTVEDIRNLTPRFWQFHIDPILLMDGGLVTLLTIHTNLCAGTLAKFVHNPHVEQILRKLLTFEMKCVPWRSRLANCV
jgi:hypothetical protein